MAAKKSNHAMMDWLNELIGGDAARKLAVIYGGTRFYFSESKLCLMRLTVMMGEADARKLIAAFGGTAIEIPRYCGAAGEERAQQARADRDSGMTVRDIALKHEITERAARMILNSAHNL